MATSIKRTVKRLLVHALLPSAPLLARTTPLAPVPGYSFGGGDTTGWRAKLREGMFNHVREFGESRDFVTSWHDGLKVNHHLGNDQSRCLYVGGCFEPNEMCFVATYLKPGMVFVDIGANEGLYSLLASRRVGSTGHVIAIEPSRRELASLQKNLALNNISNVEVIGMALGAEPGNAILHIAEQNHGGHNTFGAFAYEHVQSAGDETVAVCTLDSALAERPNVTRVDLLKIDAEGSEPMILEGAASVILQHRPAILLEANDASLRHRGSNRHTLIVQLRDLGYTLHDFSPATGQLEPLTDEPRSENLVALYD